MQTCNGCHTADGQNSPALNPPIVLESFYHVSPTADGGADGTGRLSNFLLNTDLPARESFLKATLCAGNCPGVSAVQTSASRVH
jgi:hypothetical protein